MVNDLDNKYKGLMEEYRHMSISPGIHGQRVSLDENTMNFVRGLETIL
jgi:hypothetical protein